MSKAKNKAKSNLAQRNKEALAKAKAAVKTTKTVEKTETKEKKDETVKSEKVLPPYDHAVLIAKDPEKYTVKEVREFVDDKKIHQISFSFVTKDGKTEGNITFPKSCLKEGDSITITVPLATETKTEEKPASKAKVDTKPEPKETKVDPNAAKQQKQPKQKKEEILVPEEVKPEPKKEEVKLHTDNLVAKVHNIPNLGRIDENHQIEFLNMLRSDLAKEDHSMGEELKAGLNEVYQVGRMQMVMIYAAQLEKEGKAVLGGETIQKELFPQVKKAYLDFFGVTVKALESKTDDSQLQIKFEDIPKDVKDAAKADAKAPEIFDIPEADPNLSEEQKLEVLRSIMKRTNASEGSKRSADRRGLNLVDAIEWARKAFEIKSEEPAATVALLCEKFGKDSSALLLKGFTGMSYSGLLSNNTPLIPHAIFSMSLKEVGFNDSQIANVVRTFCVNALENTSKDEKEFTQKVAPVNNLLKYSTTEEIIQSILDKQEAIPLAVDGLPKTKNSNINGAKIYSTYVNMIGSDSPAIISEKLKEVAQYYTKPLGRLANYKDESAYSKS